MSFLTTMARLVFDSLPWSIAMYLPIILLIVGLLTSRRRAVERRFLGRCRVSFWRELAIGAVIGIAGGYLGSLLLFLLGVTLGTEGFVYILLLAFVLMLIDMRYICLSYAGGLLSLFSLATGLGLPRSHIPGLLGLVAVLHLTESALILADGSRGALPVYMRVSGRTVGGYLLQRIWPVPLLALSIMAVTSQESMIYLNEPNWWPLIPLGSMAAGLVFVPIPAAAAIGYGDLAVTVSPRAKAVRTACFLSLFSLALLLLTAVSVRIPAFAWVAALFAPVGHELVLYSSRRSELRRKPAYTSTADGLTVLAVLPGTRAAETGLKPGEVITGVNGHPVRSKEGLQARLSENVILTTLAVRSNDGTLRREIEIRGDASHLGIMLAPDPQEQAQVDIGPWRFLPGRRASW